MKITSLPIVCTLLLAFAQASRAGDPPPGMVLVPGGRTRIGIDERELMHLLNSDPDAQNFAGSLSAETPHHEMPIESFFLMTTEVTNEQYAAYVRAAGAKPPESWGEAAIRTGRERFFQSQPAQKSSGAQEQFDPHAWWDANWKTSSFDVPAADAALPVVFVDYKDALGYARWAGVRLPTEFEYERAVRGDTNQTYPWGNEWDNEKYAATSLLKKKSSLFPVGSFPAGASKQGVLDLVGNAWEWTSSSYTPFHGYEPKVYTFGYGTKAHTVNAVADWNAEQRVVVGGSFQNSNVKARATARRGADLKQATDALGFRCAASLRAGVDLALMLLEQDISSNIRPRNGTAMVGYATDATVGTDRWTSTTPSAGSAKEDHSAARPPEYALITSHDYALFTPVKMLNATEQASLDKLAASEGPIPIGIFSTSLRVKDPDLQPGTYMVSWRARGLHAFASIDSGTKHPPSEGTDGAPLEETLPIDIAHEYLIFTDLSNKPVRAMRAHLDYNNWREARVHIDEVAATDEALPTEAEMSFELCVACRTTKKGFNFTLPLRFEKGALEGAWR